MPEKTPETAAAREHERERVTRALCRLFRVPQGDYVTNVKLLYIYDWVVTDDGYDPFIIIAVFRKVTKRPSNREIVDALYEHAFATHLLAQGSLAPRGARPPASRDPYVTGWRV